MYRKECVTTTRATRVAVSEKGKSAVFLNFEKQPICKVQYDGCHISQQVGCDWLVLKGSDVTILVELKGSDIDRALIQIEATLAALRASDLLSTRMAALIVCASGSVRPAYTSKIQKVQQRLSRDYRTPLHVVTRNREYQFDAVLKHGGVS